jgi:hypothetical protein
MVTTIRKVPSPPLLEADAPGWARRFAERLNTFFKLRHPQAPNESFICVFADLPPAADWTGCLAYTTDGRLWFSNGTAWLQLASVAPPPAPWSGFSGYLLPPGNVVLTLAQLGFFVVANVALTATLPAIATVPAGQGYWFQANAAITLQAAAGNNVYQPSTGLGASRIIGAGKSSWAISDGGATWIMSGTGA